MALMNHIAQSFFYLFVEYGFGLDPFTRTGVSADPLLVVAVTVARIIVSRTWLRGFRFGPLEWL